MKLHTKIFLSLVLLVFISLIGITTYFYNYFKSPIINEDTYFIINKGDNLKKIIHNLNEKINLNKKYNNIYLYTIKLLYKKKIIIKSGEYFFSKNFNLIDIFKTIKSGKVYYRKITFAEGLSNDSIFKIINNTYGLVGELPQYEILEGSLLPETYKYTYGETKENLIKKMMNDMTNFINKEWETRDNNLPFTTKEELISLASIIEKETGLPTERNKVSSVFINRLKKKMKLQSDPTVIYAFTNGNKDLEREIRKSDLKAENEYNTYHIYGIPKKAICNPGKEAIKATLHPENTDYLYFVATGNGGHNFSSKLEDHNKYVKEYRKIINNK